MNLKHHLFDPRNWDEDQKESAVIMLILAVLAAFCITAAFLLPAGWLLFSMLLAGGGAFLLALAGTGFMIEFWEKRNE